MRTTFDEVPIDLPKRFRWMGAVMLRRLVHVRMAMDFTWLWLRHPGAPDPGTVSLVIGALEDAGFVERVGSGSESLWRSARPTLAWSNTWDRVPDDHAVRQIRRRGRAG
jgi:hypothetical protein